MKRVVSAVVCAALAAALTTCSDKSSNPVTEQTGAKIMQAAGCIPVPLFKHWVRDSCFNYVWRDTIAVEFCVSGNCCPDSNRFVLSCGISGDTLLAAVSDTAENQCKCVCTYLIRAEYYHLSGSSYRFVCSRPDDSGKVYYSETVSLIASRE